MVGKATRITSFLTDAPKTYQAEIELGISTDTYDAEGKIIENLGTVGVTKEKVIEVINGFIGKSDQVPPMYSAVKKGGVPLYKLARKGVTIEREPKTIEVFSIDITKVEIPTVKYTVNCSGGTYVRSLCYDAGVKLGCGAFLKELRRTKSSASAKQNSAGTRTSKGLEKGSSPLPRAATVPCWRRMYQP